MSNATQSNLDHPMSAVVDPASLGRHAPRGNIVVPRNKVSPEAQRQALVSLMSLISLGMSGYQMAVFRGPNQTRVLLAIIAGIWLFLLVHSARANAEAREG